MTEIFMPKTGMDMKEGRLIRWLKKVGDPVELDEPIMEIETDKITMEAEAPASGILLAKLVDEDTTVPVLQTIGWIGQPGEKIPDTEVSPAAAAPASEEEEADTVGLTEVFMPKAGMDMKEGRLIRWLKNVGDPVELDEPIMEIETDKITMEAEAPATGYLLSKLVEDGTVVPVLQTIGWIGPKGAKAPGAARIRKESSVSAEVSSVPAAVQPTGNTLRAHSSHGLVAATPYARQFAKEKGIDLAAIPSGGPIRFRDVLEALKKTESAARLPETQPAAAESREPTHITLTPTRRAIARNMYNSLQTMAQTSDSVEVDVTDLVNIRKALVACKEQLGVRISVNDLLSFAAVKMIRTHPLANASFAETEIICYPYVNLCTAVATSYGLTSPVVHDADRMNLWELSRALHDVTSRARDQKLTAKDLAGGTFTLTNMGIFPVDNFNPILPSPQSCILGFGRCVEKPAVWSGEICIRTRMVLSITYDHRVFDGGEVGSIMKTMKEYLEEPSLFLGQ